MVTRATTAVLCAVLAAGLAQCSPGVPGETDNAMPEAKAKRALAPAPAAVAKPAPVPPAHPRHPGAHPGAHAGKQGPDEPCEGHGNSPTHLTDDRVVQKSGPMGQVTLRAGKALAGAPVASIPDLLGKPDGFEGKAVRVKGHVAAMCHHRRAWFAVAGEDKSGRLLRVIASPAFLVPPGSIGRTVTVEGTVDAIEMSPGKARHLQKEHKLGLPTDATAPVRQVVLRATGAEFG